MGRLSLVTRLLLTRATSTFGKISWHEVKDGSKDESKNGSREPDPCRYKLPFLCEDLGQHSAEICQDFPIAELSTYRLHIDFRFRGVHHAFMKILSEGGIRGLWAGWVPNVQRAALVNMGGKCNNLDCST